MLQKRLDHTGLYPPPRAQSAADKLASKFLDDIAQGKFVVGSSLPSERELMGTHEVSRATVREALRMLAAQGLIHVKRGRKGGSFVSNPSTGLVVESLNRFIQGHGIRLIDLVFAREAIEPSAAAQAAISRTEERLESLRLACLECENTFHDRHDFVRANLAWHLALAEASGNPLFITFLTSIWSALHTATDFEEFDTRTRKAVVGVHWQIFEAVRAGQPEAARRRMARHLSAYADRLSSIETLPELLGPSGEDEDGR